MRSRAIPLASVVTRRRPDRTTTPGRAGITAIRTRVLRPVRKRPGRIFTFNLAHGRVGTSTWPGVAVRMTQPPSVVRVTGEPAPVMARRGPSRLKRATLVGGASKRYLTSHSLPWRATVSLVHVAGRSTTGSNSPQLRASRSWRRSFAAS